MKRGDSEKKYIELLLTELKIKRRSQRTQETYSFFIKKYLQTIKKDPRVATEQDIKLFLAITTDSYSNSSQALVISALKYFYKKVLKLNLLSEIESPKKEEYLPVVLTREEVKKLINSAVILKSQLIIRLLYSSGLRVSELLSLKKTDLDLENNTGWVRKGKGGKDRKIFLSKALSQELQVYINGTNSEFLFSGQKGKMTPRNAQKIIERAAKRAGISKRVTPHTMRHSYATHLLESGVDIRKIQVLLGHSRIDTTQIYTKVSTKELEEIRNPLDNLE